VSRPGRAAAWCLVAALTFALPSAAADKNGVAPTVISLPTGPGSIEGLGESFQPQLNTGTARYAVKIPLPRGHNSPELTLRYESGFGDGPAGIGWVYGPGSIARQVDKGLPRYVDGPNGRDDDGDGTVDEADEEDLFVGPEGEELVRTADGAWRAGVEGRFASYRRVGERWEVRLRNGTLLDYGLTPAGLIADATGARVYRWLLERSTDANGNVVEYAWSSFAGSDNQQYLREIRFGPGGPPWAAHYFVSFTYEPKPDWRADYRPGFLLKTGQRLARVEIGVQGVSPEGCLVGDWNGDGIADALVGRYLLAYDPARPGRSFLQQVTRVGADGESTLPPIRFAYTAFDPAEHVSAAAAMIGSADPPLSVMDSALVEFADLNRDGLPDLLRTDREGGDHVAYLNRGAAADGTIRWDAGRSMGSADGLAPLLHLDEQRVHLADMDGDGLADLVQTTAGGDVLWHANRGDASWGERRGMIAGDTAPPAPFASRDVATADLDFDKRSDVVRSTENGYSLWLNLGEGRYSREVRTAGALHEGRVMLFSDPGAQLADLNGDRLVDVIRVRPTEVVVAAGMGRGSFATAVAIPIPGETLDETQIARAKLADINGDGLADLVVERAAPGELHCWLNLGTDAFSPRIVVTDLPTLFGERTAVRWADLNGNGSVDLVYADSGAEERLRALDLGVLLGGSEHPNLLSSIENGLGVETRITWRSSTAFFLADRTAGRPWTSTLPFPVPVVAAVETTTGLDLDAAPGLDRHHTDYAYRDGFYEDRERAFRGFGEVRAVQLGDGTAATRVGVTGFFTGGPDGVDNDGDGLVDEIQGGRHREEEALTGLVRFTESRTLAGALLLREENLWRVRTLLTGVNGTEVRLGRQTRSDRLLDEGTGAPVTIRTEFVFDDFGNPTEVRKHGALAIAGDEAFTFTDYVNDTGRWILGLPTRARVTDGAGSLVAETMSYYDGPEYVGLPRGRVERGNLTRTLGRVREGVYVDLVRNARDGYGNITRALDPNGNLRTVDWDPVMHVWPVRESIAVGGGAPDLVISAAYHAGFGAMSASTGFNGRGTSFGYDCFGRLTSVVKPGDSAPLPTLAFRYRMADPARGLTYDYDAAGAVTITAGPVAASSVLTRAREVSGAGGTLDVVKYTDGLGRALATVSETETGFAVSKAALFNALGSERLSFLPYAAGSAEYAVPNPANPALGHRYDALGREVERINPAVPPAGTTSVLIAYRPLERSVTDEEGKRGDFLSDGLGRVVEVRRHDAAAGEVYSTISVFDPLDRLVSVSDPLGNTRSLVHDGLGRRTRVDDPDRGRSDYEFDAAGNLVRRTDNKGQVTLYTYDGANRLLAEFPRDGSGPAASVAYAYDAPAGDYPAARNLAGRLSWVEDRSGRQFFSYDDRGNRDWWVRRITDRGVSRDFRRSWEHDALGRVTAETFPDGDRVAYGFNAGGLLESIPGVVGDVDYLPSGAATRIAFANGVTTQQAFDPRGRLSGILTAPAAGDAIQDLAYTLDGVGNLTAVADGRPGASGSPDNASQAYAYDDLHRLVGASGPSGTVTFAYDPVGNLVTAASADIPDPLVNLGTLAYGGGGGTGGRGRRLPGDPPGPHAVTAAGAGLAYLYDDNGNMKSRAGSLFDWDFGDRMARARVGTAEVRFVYDCAGHRVIKEETDGAAVESTWYIDSGYEIRAGLPVKQVFAGGRRVAQIEGRLAPGPAAGEQTLRFETGMNFFSLGLLPADTAPAAVLAPISGSYTGLWSWNAATQAYETPASLLPGRGYVINVTAPVTLTVTGSASTEALPLAAGWNLLGCPSANALRPADAFAGLPGVEAAWGYETLSSSWQVWMPAPPSGLPALTLLEPGRAYWVKASTPETVAFAARPTRVLFYHPDHIGSTAVVTDGSGSVVARSEYYPYGRPRYQYLSAGVSAPYGFIGAELDAETGLLALGARYADPVTGRFLSVDPALEDAYAYGWNNPLRFFDPSGNAATPGNNEINRQIGGPPPTAFNPGEETKGLAEDVKKTGEKLGEISIKDVVNFLVKELLKYLGKTLMSQIGSPFLQQLVTNLLESDILDVDYGLNAMWEEIDTEFFEKPILQQVVDAGGEDLKGFFNDVNESFLKPVGNVAEGALTTAVNALGFVSSLPGGTFLTNPIAEKMRSLETDVVGAVREPLQEVDQLAGRVSRATQAPSGPNVFWDGNGTAKMISAMQLMKGMDRFLPSVP
jgi:RHS repeat-associated protein